MTDLRTRLTDVLLKHWPQAYACEECGTHLECSCHYQKNPLDSWTVEHLADVLLSLPGVTMVDREKLAQAITGGIRNYVEGIDCEYEGELVANGLLHRVYDDAPSITQYIFTSTVLAATEEEDPTPAQFDAMWEESEPVDTKESL